MSLSMIPMAVSPMAMSPLTTGSLGSDVVALGSVVLLFIAAMAGLIRVALDRGVDGWQMAAHTIIATLGAAVLGVNAQNGLIFSDTVAIDAYGRIFTVIFAVAGVAVVLLSPDYLERIGTRIGEYYALILFALMGMILMATGNDLILLFVALEIMSISLYVLVALRRDEPKAVEGGFKYFILGAFSSAIFLYGIAFIYGATGTTNLTAIGEAVAHGQGGGLLLAGMALLFVGFAFKVGSVPFHMWVPDVYEGAPTTVTALMATGVKAASFAAFGRVLFTAFPAVIEEWVSVVVFLSAITMLLGNVAALVQKNLKRMLAYSSVGHAGFALMALVGIENAHSMLFYLLAYTFMTLGAFAVLSIMTEGEGSSVDVDDLAGAAAKNPWLAAGLTLCLLSLAGIPPTMGFVGKFSLLVGAVNEGHIILAVVGAISGAIGVYYYLRPIIAMYMREGSGDSIVIGRAAATVLGIACAAIVIFGILPELVLPYCREGMAVFFG